MSDRDPTPISVSGGGVTRTGIGVAIHIPLGRGSIRGKLHEDLYGCASAQAIEITVLPNGLQGEIGLPFEVHDPLNVVATALIALLDDSGELYVPSGTCFTATWYDDSQQWEVDNFGFCCPQGSGSEGSEGSEEGSEGSEGSGSEGSEGSQESGSGCVSPEQLGLSGIANYDPEVTQVLGHDAFGCMMWIDVESCAVDGGSGSSGSGA